MTGQVVKRKINSFDNENFINIKNGYYTFKTTDKINWAIADEIKKVENYTLQKATTKFGGEAGLRGSARIFHLMKALLNCVGCPA